MKIYDISQEVFSCKIYPGDPAPAKQTLCATETGDTYNLTAFSMCAHNGTHIDAPFHFLHTGKTVDQMDLSHFVGECYVARHQGLVTDTDAKQILQQAQGAPRILIAGQATVTAESAEVFAARKIKSFLSRLRFEQAVNAAGGAFVTLLHGRVGTPFAQIQKEIGNTWVKDIFSAGGLAYDGKTVCRQVEGQIAENFKARKQKICGGSGFFHISHFEKRICRQHLIVQQTIEIPVSCQYAGVFGGKGR